MPKDEILAGLDIGSNQVCCVIGKRSEDNRVIEVISAARLPCRGIKGGVVINLQETASAVQHVVEKAEEKAQETIRQVYLGLRGSHIESMNAHGKINISRTDKEITAEDVASVIETAKTIRLSPDREILHTIPQEFSLNHQGGVPNPVGMEGNFLEVDVHILTASSSHINNIYKVIAQAGLEIAEPLYGCLAVGDLVITQEEKELGCLLIDFGGLTTGLVVYTEGSIRYSRELQIGSDFITRDISHSLRTSQVVAQDIKEKYGISMASLLKDDSTFEYMSVDGRTIRECTRKQLVEIIQPRLDQIFVALEDEIKKSGFAEAIVPGGVIVTGGGSRLEGIIQAAEQALSPSARLGLPQDVTGPEDIVSNQAYSTAIGLLKADSIVSGPGGSDKTRPAKSGPSLITRFKDWVNDAF